MQHCQVGLASSRSLGGVGDVVLVVLALTGQTDFTTTLDLSLPTSEDRPFCGAMVEQRDGPSCPRDDDGRVEHEDNDD